jgi:hypothetical protein
VDLVKGRSRNARAKVNKSILIDFPEMAGFLGVSTRRIRRHRFEMEKSGVIGLHNYQGRLLSVWPPPRKSWGATGRGAGLIRGGNELMYSDRQVKSDFHSKKGRLKCLLKGRKGV